MSGVHETIEAVWRIEATRLIAAIADRAGIREYQVLHSEEEFKKSSMEYF